MWYEQIVKGLSGRQIINDSKTPSGRVHVGSLRGVLIHDALYRALRDKGVEVTYKYGFDDYDPLDGLPADASSDLQAYMGYPLCNIPAPEGSSATDFAAHYAAEFLEVFSELGVGAEIYRMRDVYRSGQFNEAIDVILKKADVVRKVYAEVSKSTRPSDWHPFQVVCENCKKVGTTEVTAYDGKEVTYECKPDLVKWASGCGHKGKVSPFDGNGKLPWKLEWTAKWHTFGVTLEGAGKDHCTKGGSRDVANRCLREIFGDAPPLNVPYEFFLVSGAKMSSSKGVGSTAREMANFLPPEILRFLVIRTAPKRTVNFATDLEYIVKLFNEHDRLVEANLAGCATEPQQKSLRMIEVNPESTSYHPIGFQLLTALLQLPHLEVESEIERRTAGGLSSQDKENLQKRIAAARYWLENYASEEDRVELQDRLPESAAFLTASQKAFLRLLGENFPVGKLGDDEYQKYIFDTARLTPIGQKAAFAAIYRALLDKDQGPKGGSLFSYLDREFLVNRFLDVEYSRNAFWEESGITRDECETWLVKHKDKIETVEAAISVNAPVGTSDDRQGAIEITATLADGKTHGLRILLRDLQDKAMDSDAQAADVQRIAKDFRDDILSKHYIAIELAEK